MYAADLLLEDDDEAPEEGMLGVEEQQEAAPTEGFMAMEEEELV